MKFLYGDSVPFPLGFDFLATLGAFMKAATRVVMLDQSARKDATAAQERADAREAEAESLRYMHDVLVRSLDEALSPGGPRGTLMSDTPPLAASKYATDMKDASQRLVDERSQAGQNATASEAAKLAATDAARHAEMRSVLEEFVGGAELPVLSARVSLQLRDGKNELGVVFRNQGEVVTSFVLGAAKQPEWSAPRRVSELVQGLDLNVGIKKAFFKGTLSYERVHLDDWYLGRADVHASFAEIALRKKPDQKDSLVFRLKRMPDGMRAEVEHPDDPNAKQLSPGLSIEDAALVDKLSRAVVERFTPLLHQREAVVRVELDGQDVFALGLEMALVARLVAVFAPVVEEVAQRSPNQAELSLKKEHDGGRREEIYLRRSELTAALQPLDASGRAVFTPMGLDDWLPTMTVRPPKVG
jgi:hypothetical protein